MKILISAGGTAEPIDGVRSITNTGTGRLGSLIAEAFAREESVSQVHYVCDPRAVRPFAKEPASAPAGKIEEHVTHGTQEVLETMRRILETEEIDAVIQSMAISDYTTDSMTDLDALAGLLAERAEGLSGAEQMREALLSAIRSADLLKEGKKVSSSIEHPLILLKKTPKILPQLKDFRPDILLVGFKLLNHVSREELFEVARHQMQTARCDYVLANDYAAITAEAHEGWLLGRDGSAQRFATKQEIAEGICRELVQRIRG